MMVLAAFGIFVGLLWAASIVLYALAKCGVKSLRHFFCKIGWHAPTKDLQPVKDIDYSTIPTGYEHYVCPWCDYEGLVDSQGNLF